MVGSGTDSSNVLGITASAATNTAVSMVNNSLTSGSVLGISSSATDTTARNLATITQSGDAGASGTAGVVALKIATTSGRGILIDADDANGEEAFEIDSEIATTNSIAIDTATTTATGAHFQFNSLTDGSGIDVTTSSSNSLSYNNISVFFSLDFGSFSSLNPYCFIVKVSDLENLSRLTFPFLSVVS